jgi:hypothetical protein
MNWFFRKVFRTGPIRTTVSRSGIGVSWGIPGLRVGVSSSGKKYFTIGIPGTGLYCTRFFPSLQQPSQQNNIKDQNFSTFSETQTSEPWWKQKHLLD